MDADLPELMRAAELASTTLRALIGDLRKSPIGRGGLAPALRALAKGIAERAGIELESNVSDLFIVFKK